MIQREFLFSPRVLVIEDNAMNRELVVDVLTPAGFLILEADSAEVGIEIAFAHPPDLILMDIALPGLDGLEATILLKANAKTAHIPVVALTAHAMHGDELRARGAGCIGFITKPLDTRTLAQQIFLFLEKGEDAEKRPDLRLVKPSGTVFRSSSIEAGARSKL